MDSAVQVVRLTLGVSVIGLVFALGLKASFADLTYLFRHPSKLARALVAMFVVVPIAATVMAKVFAFPRAIEVALLPWRLRRCRRCCISGR